MAPANRRASSRCRRRTRHRIRHSAKRVARRVERRARIPFALCALPFALCALPFALCAPLLALHSLLTGRQVAECRTQDRGGFGTETIHLTILALLAAVAERRLLVPLTLGNDVADFIVGQADQHAVLAFHLAIDARLDRGIGEVGAGIGGILHLA